VADLDLARHLVAHPRCRGVGAAGKFAGFAPGVTARLDSGLLLVVDAEQRWQVALDDPATAGVLLAMLAPEAVCVSTDVGMGRACVSVDTGGGLSCVRRYTGPTLGAACAAALLACWGAP
jgi:hypothetical protein